jgi:hypothetical protein
MYQIRIIIKTKQAYHIMIHFKKSAGYVKGVKYLFMLFLSAGILFSSANAYTHPDTSARRDRPQPPPHPKPKSIKEVWNKINPFKKHKDSSKADDPKPLPPPPAPPQPQPQPVTPKPAVKHKYTTKKKKTTTTPDTKKTDKPAQPLI